MWSGTAGSANKYWTGNLAPSAAWNGFACAVSPPAFLFKGAEDDGLYLNTDVDVDGFVCYWYEPNEEKVV